MMKNQRYERNILYKEVGEDGQRAISESIVAVVGCGGLGSSLLQHLSACGVGTIKLIDFDVVGISNLNRQILFCEADIGQSKVMKAYQRLSKLNSTIKLLPVEQKLTLENGFEILKGADVVVDCTDNYEARYILDEICSQSHQPLVHGAVEGMRGMVTIFHGTEGGRYSDLFGENMKSEGPVGVISPSVGTIASIQSGEVIKLITKRGKPLYNKLLIVDLLENNFEVVEI